jgi:PKD repeat protein
MLFMKYSHGMLHALWRQREGEGNYIFYALGSVNGAWGTPIKVSHGGESEYPGLDVDKYGKVHIVYSDVGRGGERDVFYVNLDQVTSYPVVSFTASPQQGNPPLAVSFDASASYDPDGRIVSYRWDFGDGGSGSGVTASHTFTRQGSYTVELTATDDEKQSSTGTCLIQVGTPPVAVISASPTSGGSPLTVYFDGSGSYDTDGSIVSYTWDFGDGTSGSGSSVEHTYTDYATRTATLVVTDNNGLEGSDSVEIEITQDPIARIKYSPKSGQPPLKVSFDASNSKPADRNNGKIVSYQWDFGDGGSGSGAKPSHKFKKAASYTVTLEITDDQGLTDSATVEVNVYSKPTAAFTCSPKEGIAPLAVSFNASKSSDKDGKIVTYRWVFGDGTTGTGKTISHTFSKGGTFTVWMTVTDDDGWQDSTYNKVTVIEKPYAPVNFSVQNVVNRSLYFTDCLNVLTWSHNSKNAGKIQVSKYIIYRRQKGSSPDFIYIGETGPGVSRFEDLSPADETEMKSYIYGIRAVDGYGRESDIRKVDAGK